uniref:(northern house mosquito) hypothetical protein n=1 Tax=Culex pipiens TaxID=7175 RepID=A0A8D8G9S2_CULPI
MISHQFPFDVSGRRHANPQEIDGHQPRSHYKLRPFATGVECNVVNMGNKVLWRSLYSSGLEPTVTFQSPQRNIDIFKIQKMRKTSLEFLKYLKRFVYFWCNYKCFTF